jgi:hypothetical protein
VDSNVTCRALSLSRAVAFRQHVAAARREIFALRAGPYRRQRLPRQRHDRRMARRQRDCPAFRRLDPVGRTEDLQMRDSTQARELLDRLVRRPVLAEADRVMRHDVDDALLHQRR